MKHALMLHLINKKPSFIELNNTRRAALFSRSAKKDGTVHRSITLVTRCRRCRYVSMKFSLTSDLHKQSVLPECGGEFGVETSERLYFQFDLWEKW